MSNIDHSGNLVLLVEILRNCELVGDKLLFSSQSITTLEKEFLTMEDSKSRNWGGWFLTIAFTPVETFTYVSQFVLLILNCSFFGVVYSPNYFYPAYRDRQANTAVKRPGVYSSAPKNTITFNDPLAPSLATPNQG